MSRRIRTIDAHSAGEPLRLITDGFPSPTGKTMQEKRGWLRKHADRLRRALMLEPRGHSDMYGAVLTEPVSADADAGVLFMHGDGYGTMCAHGIIAVTTIVLERDLLRPRHGADLLFDSPAGLIRARSSIEAPMPRRAVTADRGPRDVRVSRVAFTNVPSTRSPAIVTRRTLSARTSPRNAVYGRRTSDDGRGQKTKTFQATRAASTSAVTSARGDVGSREGGSGPAWPPASVTGRARSYSRSG